MSRNPRDILINTHSFSSKVVFIFVGFPFNFNFPERFSANSLISDEINVLPVGADLFLKERWMDRRTLRR